MTQKPDPWQAYEAFELYRLAKLKADRTLTFADAHQAAQAWVRFQNYYLGIERQLDPPIDQKGTEGSRGSGPYKGLAAESSE